MQPKADRRLQNGRLKMCACRKTCTFNGKISLFVDLVQHPQHSASEIGRLGEQFVADMRQEIALKQLGAAAAFVVVEKKQPAAILSMQKVMDGILAIGGQKGPVKLVQHDG